MDQKQNHDRKTIMFKFVLRDRTMRYGPTLAVNQHQKGGEVCESW